MTRLVLVLGDQLSHDVAALRAADRDTDVVVMAEVMAEGTYVAHHPQKIALILSAMRHFAQELRDAGWTVAYSRLDDPGNGQTIASELFHYARDHEASGILATRPGEHRLIGILEGLPIPTHVLEDDRFIASHADFDGWAEGRKSLRMEYFYRGMRKATGLLMDDGEPCGGQWNFDHDNRQPAKADLFREGPPSFTPDAVTEEVLDLVAQRFPDHFGTLRPFRWAVDRDGALTALAHFIDKSLPDFGTYQDAMLEGDPTLAHALLSAYMNTGLLSPMEVCRAAEAAYRAGRVPINSAEGFVRQILGWREYMRGVYFREGPDYTASNFFGHDRALPALYWGAPTRMACLSAAVAQTRDMAYAHHIQRLMLTGSFALLAGVAPQEVHEWYLSVYIDAYEWVEAPNTLGMSQFADGGLLGSKPYISSGAYINRMSDYCGGCAYRVRDKTGEDACPFNLLYWHFLDRHRDRLAGNSRLSRVYANWDRMEHGHKRHVIADAGRFLERLDAGEEV